MSNARVNSKVELRDLPHRDKVFYKTPNGTILALNKFDQDQWGFTDGRCAHRFCHGNKTGAIKKALAECKSQILAGTYKDMEYIKGHHRSYLNDD